MLWPRGEGNETARTQGKAKKARDYRIPVKGVADFLAETSSKMGEEGGHGWTARCAPECRRLRPTPVSHGCLFTLEQQRDPTRTCALSDLGAKGLRVQILSARRAEM